MRDYECAALCETMRERGRELLKIRVKYPVFGEYPKIDAFYADIASRCFEYAKGKLWETVRAKFLEERASGARLFRGRAALYSVACRVTRYDDEFLSLYLDVVQSGGSGIESVNRLAQTWRLADCTLLPLGEFVPPRGKNKRLSREDYYLRGESAVVFTNRFRPGDTRRFLEPSDFIEEREIAL